MASTRPENGAQRHEAATETDRVLLSRFVRNGDEAAFTRIVRRHSSLVFGVCHRTLRDRQAAEDAFQATFLVLARSAPRIRRRASLGSWLHGVACRVSLRSLAKRHRRRETCSPMNTITTEPTLRDVAEIYEQQLLDAELGELPEKYREPLVLHYLQGLTNQQVADRLDVSVSCVEGRLKRGRKELRLRLTRRGIELGAALAAVHLTTAAAQAGALESLITSTAHVAATHALTSTSAAAAPSEAASQLAAKEIAMLASTKTGILLTGAAAAALVVGVTVGLNSSSGVARADGPARSGTPQIETTIDVSDELAQSTTVQPAPAEPTAEDLQRTIQSLRDQISELERGRDQLAAQYQSEQATALVNLDQLSSTIAQKDQELAQQGRDIDTLRQALEDLLERAMPGGATREPAVTADEEASWDVQARDPQTRRIMAALDLETNIEFPGNPLRDVLDYISQSHDVPILLDEARLSEAGISPDEEVSLVLSGVTLQNAMEIMFNNLAGVELDYIVENQVLKITTREHADSIMETRVYSLNQLPAEYAPEDVARVIIRSIAPESWRNSVVRSEYGSGEMMEMGGGYDAGGYGMDVGMGMIQPVGGPGAASIEPLPGVLVVTQSQRVHRQIVDLLTQLKRQQEAAGSSGGGFSMEGMYGGEGLRIENWSK